MEHWKLTEEELNDLPSGFVQKYEKACKYKQNEHAGSYNGWAVGNEMLIEMGWKEVVRTVEHRQYVSLVKPIFLA